MGVNPDESDLLLLLAIKLGHARNRAGGHRVIAAEDEGEFPRFESLEHRFRVLGAGGGDFFEILCVWIAFLLLFGNGHGDVAAVFDYVSQRFQPRFQTGNAHGGRSHVYPAA